MLTVEQFKSQVHANPSARSSLRRLVQDGCDEEGIIELIFVYSSGLSSEERNRKLKGGGRTLARWKRLASDLQKLATAVDGTITELAKQGVERLYFKEGNHPADVMRMFADNLETICKNFAPAADPKSGTNESLAFLGYCVKEATGETNYPSIAVLLEIFDRPKVRLTGVDLAKAAQKISKRIRRFERPGKDLLREAKIQVAGWIGASPTAEPSS